jgi:hypothetical protein
MRLAANTAFRGELIYWETEYPLIRLEPVINFREGGKVNNRL